MSRVVAGLNRPPQIQIRQIASGSAAVYALLRHLDFLEQFGMPIQHLEQLDRGQGRLGLAVFVARECIEAATESTLRQAAA
jgi:hypothetical protein